MITDPGLFARMHAAREGELAQAVERRRRRHETLARGAVPGRAPGRAPDQSRLAVALARRVRALARWARLLTPLRARTPNRLSDCASAPVCCQASV